MAEATCRLSAQKVADPGGKMDNTVYELTKFKIPRVKTTEFGVMIMCRCDLCGQLFTPEIK
jgi:hypothetical protein